MNELQIKYCEAISNLLVFESKQVDDLSRKSELMFDLVVAENNLIDWLVKVCGDFNQVVTADEIIQIANEDKITFRMIAFGISE